MLENFIMPKRASVLVGGQFGSEAKGLAAGVIAANAPERRLTEGVIICTTNAGAQAGHTTIMPDGTKFVCYHLPTIGVLLNSSTIYLNAGSIIDCDLLRHEIMTVAHALGRDPESIAQRLVIHPNAAVITESAKASEILGTRHLGSTQKGVGAAQADKIMRKPMATMGGAFGVVWPAPGLTPIPIHALDLNREMRRGTAVTVEVPQGTGLSLSNAPFYPKCTSRDCWVGSGLTDAGINPIWLQRTVMVCRTFPIRVGHITDPQTGEIWGDSGPFYGDSRELSWSDFPGVEPERTTVTKRIRRIASWSDEQYIAALRLNQPSDVIITFINYMKDPAELAQFHRRLTTIIHNREGISPNMHYSWGPRTDQIGEYAEASEWMMSRQFPHIGEPHADPTRASEEPIIPPEHPPS